VASTDAVKEWMPNNVVTSSVRISYLDCNARRGIRDVHCARLRFATLHVSIEPFYSSVPLVQQVHRTLDKSEVNLYAAPLDKGAL
jgi:hypothetical protein